MSVAAPLPENNGLSAPVLPWPLHPACAAWPEMSPRDLQATADDIAANGQHELIALTPAGELLDGRNRALACLMAGPEPRTFVYHGDPWLYSVSKNKHRRHISKDLIALATARIMETKPVGANQHEGGSNELPSNARIAAEAGITETAIKSAKTVLKHGTPEEIAAVETGVKKLRHTVDKVRDRRRALVPPAPPKPTPKPAEPASPAVDPIDAVARAIISQCSDGKFRSAPKITTVVKFAENAVREALKNLGEDCVDQRKNGDGVIEYRIEANGEALLRRTLADRDREIVILKNQIAEKNAEIERLTELLTAPPRPTPPSKKAGVSKH
jgi:hypothetical protein